MLILPIFGVLIPEPKVAKAEAVRSLFVIGDSRIVGTFSLEGTMEKLSSIKDLSVNKTQGMIGRSTNDPSGSGSATLLTGRYVYRSYTSNSNYDFTGSIQVYAQVGVGRSALSNKAVTDIIKDLSPTTDIVIALGVNDIGSYAEYKKKLNALRKMTNNKIYFAEVGKVFPGKYNGRYSVTKEQVNTFNKEMKKYCNNHKSFEYIDTLFPEDKITKDNSPDGIHYDQNTYQRCLSALRSLCGKAATTNEVLDSSDGGTTISGDTTQFKEKLKDYLGHEPSNKEVNDYILIINSLKTTGFSDAVIAGILGNMKHEGMGSPFCIEGRQNIEIKAGITCLQFEDGGVYDYEGLDKQIAMNYYGTTGVGLVQWSHSRREAFCTFSKENKDKFNSVTVTHHLTCGGGSGGTECTDNSKYCPKTSGGDAKKVTIYIANMPGQVVYMIEELTNPELKVGNRKGVGDKLKGITEEKDKDIDEATKIFFEDYESPGDKTLPTRQNTARTYGLPLVKAAQGLTTSGGTGGNGKSDAENMAAYLAEHGVWGEDELAAFSDMCEIDIHSEYLQNALRSNLSQSELEGLVNWERNINNSKEEYGIIAFVRKCVAGFGIIMIIWAVLLYLGYWFDRINQFFYIDLVGFLTIGKLHIAPDEDECTYNQKGAKSRTINHKAVIKICLFTIFIATLVITGIFYRLVGGFIDFVIRVLQNGWDVISSSK